MKQSSPCEKIIRRDIARTYPDHDFFKEKDGLGQESLFNVMKAYSLHDRLVYRFVFADVANIVTTLFFLLFQTYLFVLI